MIGQLLDGRYQVVQVLGSGGFSKTYIALDNRRPGNPKCVVKHLNSANSDPQLLQTARRLFQVEAETLEKLGHHDQIPQLLAYFEADHEFYLVQELVEGHPLSAELLPGQSWQESQVVELLHQVLSILEVVHSYGVIHRDVKPDNLIRRQQDNKLVLVDFGTVKQIRTQLLSASGQMSATIAIGTVGYMPTEQGQGKPRPNSDIYALGIIGIQALTGLNPLQFADNPETGEILWQHQVQVSKPLAAVLTKMVCYHFKDRYQSVTEALRSLQPLVNEQHVLPAVAPPEYAPTQFKPAPRYSPTQPSTIPQVLPSSPQPLPSECISRNTQNQHLEPQRNQPTGPSSIRNSATKQLPLIGAGLVAVLIAVGVALGINRPASNTTAQPDGAINSSATTTLPPNPGSNPGGVTSSPPVNGSNLGISPPVTGKGTNTTPVSPSQLGPPGADRTGAPSVAGGGSNKGERRPSPSQSPDLPPPDPSPDPPPPEVKPLVQPTAPPTDQLITSSPEPSVSLPPGPEPSIPPGDSPPPVAPSPDPGEGADLVCAQYDEQGGCLAWVSCADPEGQGLAECQPQ